MSWKTLFLTLFTTVVLLNVVSFDSNAVMAANTKPLARASHILVPTEDECDEIAAELLKAGKDLETRFAELAKERSKCPSSRKGGDLGSFGRGQMVPEFDTVAFEMPLGQVHKVRTQFGWHLVLITERSGMEDEKDVLEGIADDRDL